MTRSGLLERLNHLRERLPLLWRGLPHGCSPYVDVARRLTRTPIQVVFDVGANYGQSATEFRRWYPDASIHCFEPVSDTYKVLRANMGSFEGIHTHNFGFSDAVGSHPIAVSSDAFMSRVGTIPDGAESEMIRLETLDTFFAAHRLSQIDYLKIDTEGHDLAVLTGGATLLSASGAAIVQVEAGMNRDNRFHTPASSLTDYLNGHGYRLFGVYEQTLEWTTADCYLRRANLVFVSPETVRRNHWTG